MADAPYSHTIRFLTEESYKTSAEHGFHDAPVTSETIPSKLMLMVSELAEALESYRDPESDNMVKVPAELVDRLVHGGTSAAEYYGARAELTALFAKWQAKPKGLDIELADVLIRVFDFAGKEGIDLDAALRTKMEYNKGRPHMHGGRKV
jgi:NTP pyrophosphatase (non-canonical NTP hydrolase)